MRNRSIFVYLIISFLLVGFYFYETRREEKTKASEEKNKTLFPVSPDEVSVLLLKNGNQEIRLEKKEGNWVILHPVSASADAFAVSRLITRIRSMKFLEVMSQSPEDLSEFGLDPPAGSVAFSTGTRKHTLFIGSASPTQKGYYASKSGDQRVYLIAGDDKTALDRPLLDLRDRKLFTLTTDRIRRVVIERHGRRWILDQKQGKWMIQGREDLPVNTEKVENIIRITLWAEAQSFEKEETTDLNAYGLDTPQGSVYFSDGEHTEGIVYGHESPPDRIFAKVQERPQVLTVKKRLLDEVPNRLEDLLEKEKKEEVRP